MPGFDDTVSFAVALTPETQRSCSYHLPFYVNVKLVEVSGEASVTRAQTVQVSSGRCCLQSPLSVRVLEPWAWARRGPPVTHNETWADPLCQEWNVSKANSGTRSRSVWYGKGSARILFWPETRARHAGYRNVTNRKSGAATQKDQVHYSVRSGCKLALGQCKRIKVKSKAWVTLILPEENYGCIWMIFVSSRRRALFGLWL